MQSARKLTTGLWPVLLTALVVLLAACGSPNGNSGSINLSKAPTSQQTFTLPNIGVSDLATFDPGLSSDLPSITAIDMVFTGLVQLDSQLQIKPQLASSWDTSADGLTWTFHLKPSLKFSDGTPLTATDVAYSINRALLPAEASKVSPIYLALIKDSDKLLKGKIPTIVGDSVIVVDPATVKITTTQKAAYFLDALTYSCSYVIEKSLIDKYAANFTDHLTEGGGAGPFKVQEYTHSRQIVFVPNPNYYGPKPQLSKIIMPFYKQVETAYQAYQAGQVDTASVPSAHHADAIKKTKEYHQIPQLWINYYAMNYLAKPFDSLNMRKAFALAINKDEIVHAVWKDIFIPTNHIVPKGMAGYNPNLKGPDGTDSTKGNQTAAKQFLAAGLKDEGVTSVSQLPAVTLSYSSGSTDADNEVAAMVQMWQNVLGISVKAQPLEFNKLIDEIPATTGNSSLQFWGIAWIADYPDPQDWTTLQFDKGVPNNNMNYGQNNSTDATQQQAVQKALENADTMSAGDARMQAYNTAEQQLINDVAWMPMEQVQNAFLLKPYVQNFNTNLENLTPPDDWGKVYISAH